MYSIVYYFIIVYLYISVYTVYCIVYMRVKSILDFKLDRE